MLSGEGNAGERWKTTIGLISKKATLHVQHTFFVHFFAVVLHDYNVKLPETSWLHVLWRKCRTCSCSLFFHCRSFSPSWPLAFLIFSPPLQNFMLFLQQKMSPLFFLSRSSSFSRWASLACCPTFLFFSVFLFLYIPNLWTWQNINLSLILYTQHGYRNIFRFPFSSLLTILLPRLHKARVAI